MHLDLILRLSWTSLHPDPLLRLVVHLLRLSLGSKRRSESTPNRLHHLSKPPDIQAVQHDIRSQVDRSQPQWDEPLLSRERESLTLLIVVYRQQIFRGVARHGYVGKVVRFRQRSGVAAEDTLVDVLEDVDGGDVAPDDAAGEEGEGQEGAVDGLVDAAGELELVAEPVDVEKGRGELVEEEDWCVEVDEGSLEDHCQSATCLSPRWQYTHITQRKHTQRTDRMRQHTPPENVHMHRTHDKVPQKVAQRETLQQPAQPAVFPYPLLPRLPRSRLFPLLIEPDDVQRQRADDDGLEEGHHVDIPVDACASIEGGVGGREESPGEPWREDDVDEVVEEEGENDFVDVEGERREGECGCDGLGEVDERFRWSDGERILHRGGGGWWSGG